MKYENRVVLFLDILGFKNIIDNTLEKGKEKPKEINRIYTELEKIGNFVNSNLNKKGSSVNVTQFSDSIIVSFLDEDSNLLSMLFKTIQRLVINLVNEGFLCRGAISIGELVHSDRVVFGPALNDAYETETKAALYPRVILDKSIMELSKKNLNSQLDLFGFPIRSSYSDPESTNSRSEHYLKRDTDEKYYINYFPENIMDFKSQLNIQIYLQNLRTIIINGSKHTKPDLKVKYGWMKNKYNILLKRLNRTENIYDISQEAGLQSYLNNLKLLK